jgi:hypothetical protein
MDAGVLGAGLALAGACSADGDGTPSSAGTGGVSGSAGSNDGGTTWSEGGSGVGATSGAGGGSGVGGGSGDAGASGSTAGASGAAGAPGDGGVGCQYQKVFEQPGTVLEVKEGASLWDVQPLPGQGYFCARFEFDMQTADTLAPIKASGGCPIFTAIGGFGAQGKWMAAGLFKIYKAQASCPIGPTRLELDAFSGSDVQPSPYVLGETYHVAIEVVPFTASITLSQNGQQVGPVVTASVAGATVADTTDPRFSLGQEKSTQNAYYPNYGAIYSNVVIWADVAP